PFDEYQREVIGHERPGDPSPDLRLHHEEGLQLRPDGILSGREDTLHRRHTRAIFVERERRVHIVCVHRSHEQIPPLLWCSSRHHEPPLNSVCPRMTIIRGSSRRQNAAVQLWDLSLEETQRLATCAEALTALRASPRQRTALPASAPIRLPRSVPHPRTASTATARTDRVRRGPAIGKRP